MATINPVFSRGKYFLITHLLFVMVGGGALFGFSKDALFFFFNTWHSPQADFFFKYYTYLGDGLAYLLVAIYLCFFRSYYAALVSLCSYILTSAIAQILKRWIWPLEPRPGKYYEGSGLLKLVEGEELHFFSSFPSGHTCSAFSLFLLLSFLSARPVYGFLFFVAALLVGFSRMYLSQHFFVDVYVGSLIGVVGTCSIWYEFEKSPLKIHPAWNRSVSNNLWNT